MSRPLILVTNDDGIQASGLQAAVRVARELGEVRVVAPDRERSGVSHAITLSEPLRVRPFGEGRWSLSGTPADCVFIAVNHLLDRRPDLVISGINRGPNLGGDVLYSGTVGGAMEGTIHGIPSVALSLISSAEFDFEGAIPAVRMLLADLLQRGLEPGVTLNVNLPDASIAPFRGFRVVRLGRRFYSNDVITRTDPRGEEYLWIGGTRVTMETTPDTDCGAVQEGWASVTPLQADFLAAGAMGNLRWVERLPGGAGEEGPRRSAPEAQEAR
ncbi:MAG TPA: 5'/3'-nucleotidase SurE [Myxococcota bacterium]|nr:5'/3'-nucleotidase SurE [Myxococcota bacterium]HQK52482.1 5'/3'-nucleotidase SurE [Myxococcota bacterium]